MHLEKKYYQYMEYFPRDNMFPVILEEFRQAPERVLRRLCAFLGVTDGFQFCGLDQHYNKGDVYQLPSGVTKVLTSASVRFLAYRVIPP